MTVAWVAVGRKLTGCWGAGLVAGRSLAGGEGVRRVPRDSALVTEFPAPVAFLPHRKITVHRESLEGEWLLFIIVSQSLVPSDVSP